MYYLYRVVLRAQNQLYWPHLCSGRELVSLLWLKQTRKQHLKREASKNMQFKCTNKVHIYLNILICIQVCIDYVHCNMH